MSQLPKLNHFNYDELDNQCACGLCVAERKCNAAYSEFMSTRTQHPWTCQCDSCKTRNNLYESLLLAGVKRDTFSELSYLVQTHPSRGKFLAWVWITTNKIADRPKMFSKTWWLSTGMTVTLGWWLKKYKMISGIDMLEKDLKN